MHQFSKARAGLSARRPDEGLGLVPPGITHERGPEVKDDHSEFPANVPCCVGILLGVCSGPTLLVDPFLPIGFFEEILIDRRRRDQDDTWTVRLDARMSEDVDEVLAIVAQGNLLSRLALGQAGIVGAKEHCLPDALGLV